MWTGSDMDGDFHRRLVLGRRSSLAVAACVVAHTLWTSAAPAMSYRLFAREWHLSHAATTDVFAIYPIAVVLVVAGCGDLSDRIGLRFAMLLGVGASLAGTLMFAAAPSIGWLLAARALMGVGVGLSVGPSTAAVVAFTAGHAPRAAALITTVAQAAGFAAGLLLGGALIQYGPWPMRLNFWAVAVLLALLWGATWFLPEMARHGGSMAWQPRMPRVPRRLRWQFALAALAMMTAYSHGVIILAIGGEVAHDLVGSSNAFLNAALLSLFAVTSGAVGILGRSLEAFLAVALGGVASMLGMGLLAWSLATHGLVPFLLATSVAGIGYSLLFRGALDRVNRDTPPAELAGMLSFLYLLAYTSMGVVAITLGLVANAVGLAIAVNLAAAAVALLSLTTFTLAATQARRSGGI